MLWSVHDVTAQTMARAELLVDLLTAAGKSPLCILIVPAGEQWCTAHIATLKRWEREGHMLAAHGWRHKSEPPHGLYHRLHSALISRDVAEHLGRPRREVAGLVEQSSQWFTDVGLAQPQLYVPPAWARGAIEPADVARVGFRWLETLTGIHDLVSGDFHLLPLLGFEADTNARAGVVRASNQANLLLGAVMRKPVRVAVHPNDFELPLAGQLRRHLTSAVRSISPEGLQALELN